MARPTIPSFQGFRSPNYTQVPDELFDDLLAELSGAELKVLLYIIRRTFGFKRDADAISLSQMLNGIARRDGQLLDRGTGLSKPTLLQALRSLSKRDIIRAERRRSEERGDEPTIYRLHVTAPLGSGCDSPPVVKKIVHGVVKESIPPVVKESAPQETGKQETENSNIRTAMPKDAPLERSITTQSPLQKTISQGIEPLGTILFRRRGARPAQDHETRLAIESAVRDLAREFNDRASLASSTGRALNLMRGAKLIPPAFIATLYEARAITKDRLRSGEPVRNAMGFFFAVLEDRLGLRDEPEEPTEVPGTG